MSPLTQIGWLTAAAVMAMTLTWLVQLKTRNAGFVDVTWSAMMAFAAALYGVTGSGAGLPRLLVVMLGGIWGLRLSLHLLSRVLNEAEDGRYRALREHWNDHQGRMFGMFMLQASFGVIFSLPFLAVAANPEGALSWWTLLGIAIWSVSLAGESLADHQLAAFRRRPESASLPCRVGLWRYSRHPNYFFEWLHWFGYLPLAIGSSYWWLALLGPALMLVSLRWISGIPFTEAQALRTRGDAYRAYQQEVNMFFPWRPRTPRQARPSL